MWRFYSHSYGREYANKNDQILTRILTNSGTDYAEAHDGYLHDTYTDSVSHKKWHHLAAIVNNNTKNQKVYIDGKLKNQNTFTGTILDYSKLEVGYKFNGKIDDIKIFDKALNEAEVQGLYNTNQSCTPSFALNVTKDSSTLSLSPMTYQWIDSSGNEIQGANMSSFTPSEPGAYAVIVNFEDYTDTSDYVAVNDIVTNNQSSRLAASDHSMTIYPNPNKGKFNVHADGLGAIGSARLSVINLNGDIVYQDLIPINQGNIDEQLNLKEISSGSYILQIRTDNVIVNERVAIK